MTNHRVGKTNTRDPRPWTMGKRYKKYDSTNRRIRRYVKALIRRDPESA